MTRRIEGKATLGNTPNLRPTFNAVQADFVAAPALIAERRLKDDISIMAIGATENTVAMLLTNRELSEETPEGRRYGQHLQWEEDYRIEVMIAQEQRRVMEHINWIDDQLSFNRGQQEDLEKHIAQDNKRLQELDETEKPLLDEKQELETSIEDSARDNDAAATQADTARARFEAKLKEVYPDGKEPNNDEPDAVRDREAKLHDDAYSKHRDQIADRYKNKGLEKEFAILERMKSGEKIDDPTMEATFAKVGQAHMPVDPDVVMLRIMRREGTNDPYMQTLHAARVGIELGFEDTIRASEKMAKLQERHTQERLDKINDSLKCIQVERDQLTDKLAGTEKSLVKLKADEEKLIEQRNQAVAYKQWLDDPKTKEGIHAGQVSMDDIKKKVPQFMADGYIDDGNTMCVKPDSARGQAMIEQAVNQSKARPGLSAAGSEITTDAVTGQFNASAQNTSTTPAPPAPAPLAPERKVQAAVAAPSGA